MSKKDIFIDVLFGVSMTICVTIIVCMMVIVGVPSIITGLFAIFAVYAVATAIMIGRGDSIHSMPKFGLTGWRNIYLRWEARRGARLVQQAFDAASLKPYLVKWYDAPAMEEDEAELARELIDVKLHRLQRSTSSTRLGLMLKQRSIRAFQTGAGRSIGVYFNMDTRAVPGLPSVYAREFIRCVYHQPGAA